MKALAKNQLNRYQSAGEMRTDLQRALANQPVAAEAVMSDADRTQFIARTPPPPVSLAHRDNDYPRDTDERRRSLVWLAVVVALLLVIGAATYAIFVLGKTDKPKTVAVPSIIGQTPAAAVDTLTKLHFKPVKGEETNGPCLDNATVAKGQVCLVDPTPGTKAKDGATVTYQLFTPATVQVPALVGLQYPDAVTKLNELKLKAKQVPDDSAKPAGEVTKQDPENFASVAPGSTVTLSVSTGKVKLISVINKAQADAKTELNAAGWTNVSDNQTRATHNKGQDGTVAAMNPTPGIAYPQSTPDHLGALQVRPARTDVHHTTPHADRYDDANRHAHHDADRSDRRRAAALHVLTVVSREYCPAG